MKWKTWLLPVVSTLLLLGLIWLAFSGGALRLSNVSGDSTRWDSGWYAAAGGDAVRAVALPARLRAGENDLVKTLPRVLPLGACVYIKCNNQQITAEADGRPLTVVGVGSTVGHTVPFDLPWSMVRLTPSKAGQTLRLHFSGTGSKPMVEVYTARLGTAADVQLVLTNESLPKLVLSVLILLFSLAVLSFSLAQSVRLRERVSDGYAYLLWLVVCAGVWFLTDTDIVAVSNMGSEAFLLLNVCSYMVMPLPFLLFARRRISNLRRWVVALLVLILLHIGMQAVLLLTGALSYRVAVTVSHVLLTLCCLLLLSGVLENRQLEAMNGELRAGVVITAVSGLVTTVLFYLTPLPDNASVFRLGALGLVIALTAGFLRSNADRLLEAQTVEQLRVHEEEYRIAARQSDKHVMRFDVARRTLLQGEEDHRLFGDAREVPGMPERAVTAGLVAEESAADFRAFFDAMLIGKPAGSCTLRLRGAGGTGVWYRGEFTMIFSAAHEPLQAVISFFDVSEQREKELAYQKWKQSYAEMAPTGMNYYEYNLTRDTLDSETGRMLPTLPEGARRSLSQMVNYLTERYVSPLDEQRFRAFFQRNRLLEAYGHGIRSDRLEFRRLDAADHPLWTVATVQLIADPYSSDVQAFLLLKDVDAQKRDEMTVRARSYTDPLTGLLNRTAFEEQLNAFLQRGESDGMHALMMLDVDGFKRVNDTFGHQFGDRVLIDIAASLRTMMRSDDLIGRIGGDEYMICLKNVRDGAGFLEKKAGGICRALDRQFGSETAISGSVGVALYPRDGKTFEELYNRADKALYYAKHHGKNRYVVYHEELMDSDGTAPSAHTPFDAPAEPEALMQAEVRPERTLLIVDDVELNREILREIFKDEYKLLMAESGQTCLEWMGNSEAGVSAVLLDLLMPEMDGLEVLRRVQRDAYMASIPVIVISAAEEAEFSLRAIELGATDFVSKPFDPRLVRLRVHNAIQKRETEELRAQNRFLLVQKSDESRHQNELRYQAEHDALTGLCNEAAFFRKTRQMLDQHPDQPFVMVAFDIEKFRVINETFGYGEGDRLLCHIAERLRAVLAGRATYSRLDTDHFAICLPYNPSELKAYLAQADQELDSYDLAFDVTLSYGLYVIDDRSAQASVMYDRALTAKRTIKGDFRCHYAYYDDALRQTLNNEMEIINGMQAALQNEQFEIYLQPKCRLRDGAVVGAEALVRWNHPTRGLLAPGEFVPIFEKNGYILKLDAYVWERVCALQRRWMDAQGGRAPCPVSMNVSRVNLYNPTLVATLCGLADRYGVPRRMLELEITESVYAQDPRQLSGLVAELRAEGFPVEMDDFGSAYSSLNMLKELPVDMLKLDMRFLFGKDEDGRGGIILSSVVRMARFLSLPIVAEGVETAAQARFLSSIGCMVGQGYYFYRPMPVGDFEALLAENPLRGEPAPDAGGPDMSLRRVWSIDGDFGMMLSAMPCAASLCELNVDNIEMLRTNAEYLRLTGDSEEYIYTYGTHMRDFTNEKCYRALHSLFVQAFERQQPAEGEYERKGEDGRWHKMKLHVRYLCGPEDRALFLLTYQLLAEEGENEC